jgi:uncharacterized radical SAM superfamily Fe-S cluster-containing enzyme
MHSVEKYIEKGATKVAGGLWHTIQFVNQWKPGKSFIPKWADKPLLKSWERTKPPLGWPRETDSLCPKCVKEAREEILSGKTSWEVLINGHIGEIKARIVEEDGKIWMKKTCPKHGEFADIMAIDPAFLRHIESMYPGRDMRAHNDDQLHNHGTSSIKYGRGSVLTVDLTNRCNMMCDPCFMDANQVGFVHELSWQEIQEILDNALKIKPRRQMSIQFSGGEPTMSPYFVEAVRYAREVGYTSVQAATNGIRFAQDYSFCEAAYEAGLRYAYLQFDGIGNPNNAHRKISNLFDVKLKAIDNMHKAGIEIVLVVTLVNEVTNHQVGPVIEFATQNPGKISFISFQPVSFTGRDEDISDERRMRQRYTLSHLAHDVKKQVGITEPTRDWFPISLVSVFGDLSDLVQGPDKEWGNLSCSCHPNCGVGTALMINKNTKEMAPVPQFLNVAQLVKDVTFVNDMARSRFLTALSVALAVLRNYDPFKAPKSLSIRALLKKFDKHMHVSGKDYGRGKTRRDDPWNLMIVAGMWFQDLFNYDFRRTEMCIIPYGTQEGEISFCAYNTGVGWRNIIEKMHQNATVAEWYKQHGRHQIYAGNKDLELPEFGHQLTVNERDLVDKVLHQKGVALTASEERLMRSLAQKKAQAEAARNPLRVL